MNVNRMKKRILLLLLVVPALLKAQDVMTETRQELTSPDQSCDRADDRIPQRIAGSAILPQEQRDSNRNNQTRNNADKAVNAVHDLRIPLPAPEFLQ